MNMVTKKRSGIVLLILMLAVLHAYSMDTAQPSNQQETPFLISDPVTATERKSKNIFRIFITLKNTTKEIGSIKYMLLNEHEAEIIFLDIEHEYQHRNLGTTLMLQAFKHIRSKRIPKVSVFSLRSAIPFYKRFGAEEYPQNTGFMLFDLIKIGDPEENLKKYYMQKNSAHAQSSDQSKICKEN
ncbi:MAG: GNAT family N-acetyltransferase [Candidatus Dependentiae bacterium]|nr:GNAT family N-acetyltransferase [Candidatus Dependentiae bacterium]